MPRLDIERQKKLEPKRLEKSTIKLTELGFSVDKYSDIELRFFFKGERVKFFPYSGWHTGKSIKDGRGFNKLLKQLQND